MAILQMQKIRLVVHRNVASKVLRAVQKIGSVEFTDVTVDFDELKQLEKSAFEFNYVSGRLDFAVNFLSKYSSKTGLAGLIEGNRVFVNSSEIHNVATSFYYNDIVDTVQALEEGLNKAQIKLKSLSEEKKLLEEWRGLDLSLNTPFDTEKTFTLTTKSSVESFIDLNKSLKNEEIDFGSIEASKEHMLYIFSKTDKAKIDAIVGGHDIEIVTLPMRRGTILEEIERIDRAVIKENAGVERLETEVMKQTEYLPKLKVISDYIYWQKQKHNLISQSIATNNVLIFEGWCPKNKLTLLKKVTANKTNLYEIENVIVPECTEPPVEIENNALIQPFESITRLYGLPSSKDLDPTVFLAGFFFIFFGMSLTDVGYGLFLFTVTALILTFYKVPHSIKPIVRLIMIGGIASTLLGMLFGGYLGIDMKYLPEWAQNIQKFDPIGSPLVILGLALSLGVIQIVFGLLLGIYREAKQGNLVGGILDKGPWIAIFLSVVSFVGYSMGYLSGPGEWYTWFIYASFASLVLSNGRNEKGIIKKVLKGILGLYDSIGYFSDVLSYSRLLALGLATSALAFAVNLIALMVKDVPYIGWILVVIILLVGHLFNLAVNLLGAFIHGARLQFVEFFGKFIIGTGKNFKPFKREERNVVITTK